MVHLSQLDQRLSYTSNIRETIESKFENDPTASVFLNLDYSSSFSEYLFKLSEEFSNEDTTNFYSYTELYSGGEVCEVTNKAREVVVEYYCDSDLFFLPPEKTLEEGRVKPHKHQDPAA
jgi:hypothetical protein